MFFQKYSVPTSQNGILTTGKIVYLLDCSVWNEICYAQITPMFIQCVALHFAMNSGLK